MRNPSVSSFPLLVSTLDQGVLDRLQWRRSDPSVSVLLTTTPAATLATHDVVRLHRSLDIAARRLAGEASPDQARGVASLLRDLAVAVRRVPARQGLALFASERHAEAVQLPLPVPERVVVDWAHYRRARACLTTSRWCATAS